MSNQQKNYTMKHKILILDDEDKLRNLLGRIIKLEGFEVCEVENCEKALQKLKEHQITSSPFEVMLCDVKLPDGNGVELSQKIKQLYPELEIILLTAYGNIPDGVQAMKNGAFDYIVKGTDNNKIVPLVHRAIEKIEANKIIAQKLAQQKTHETEQKDKETKSDFSTFQNSLQKQYSKSPFDAIIGNSKIVRETAIELAKKVALTDTTVLLTGETGTGKEVFAQAIHQASSRSNENFVAINCAAFGKELLESEMFGHKAGSFTGATKDKTGLFGEADKGTIFLDEVGEMSLELQAKLLRVLETGEFLKVGEAKPTKVNVRIIAASNRDFKNEIKEGNFRADLYYRLSVFDIYLPPLRERKGDVKLLTNHFMSVFNNKMSKNITSFSDEFITALEHHNWEGNIRELKNVIERSMILESSQELNFGSLPIDMQKAEMQRSLNQDTSTTNELDSFTLASAEKAQIQSVLEYTKGNKTKTAQLLNIALTTLYRKLEEYGLN